MEITTSSTLKDVRAWLREKVHKGTTCPACQQHVKVYRRKLNSGMALSLIVMYRAGGTEFVHLPSTVGARSREEGKLRHWGLVEEADSKRPDGGRPGFWRVTELGEDFVLGRVEVPRYADIYNGAGLGLSGDFIGIREALGDQFDYSELMANEAS